VDFVLPVANCKDSQTVTLILFHCLGNSFSQRDNNHGDSPPDPGLARDLKEAAALLVVCGICSG